MKKIAFIPLALAMAAALIAGCGKEGEETQKLLPGEYLLPVMETTDLHGHIVDKDNGNVHYRMAYIADKAKDIRGRDGGYDKSRLLLLDGGDLYQGASVSNLLDGQPVFTAMDLMEYDAVALGNHEFDWGFETTVDADATMPDYERGGQIFSNEVPVVCANLYKDDSRVSATRDYVIVEKKAANRSGETISVKIGVIGFAVNYAGSIMTSKFLDEGFSIREDYAIANELAGELEASGQCDATVLLIHGAAEGAAESLGENSAFDLVLGGHSHQTLSGKTRSGITYLQGGRYGEHYAYADLKFKVDEATGAVSLAGIINPRTPEVNTSRDIRAYAGHNAEDLDEEIVAVSDEALEAIAAEGEKVIGYITLGATTNDIAGSGGRACTMANWMCDIIRRIGEADVSFVNSGGVRTTRPLDGKDRLDITVADVYEIFPFNNTTYIYDLTYAELLKVFSYAMTSGGSSLFSGTVGIVCRFRDYAIFSLEKDGTVIYKNGTWTGDWASRKVVLAVSEYLATTQRIDNYTGKGNPLVEWNNTSRLRSSDLVDNENAVRVLREEAASSGGHLYLDNKPYFVLDE